MAPGAPSGRGDRDANSDAQVNQDRMPTNELVKKFDISQTEPKQP